MKRVRDEASWIDRVLVIQIEQSQTFSANSTQNSGFSNESKNASGIELARPLFYQIRVCYSNSKRNWIVNLNRTPSRAVRIDPVINTTWPDLTADRNINPTPIRCHHPLVEAILQFANETRFYQYFRL